MGKIILHSNKIVVNNSNNKPYYVNEYVPRHISNGTLSMPSGEYTMLSNVTTIAPNALMYVFTNSTITSANLSSVVTVNERSLSGTFQNNSALTTVNMSGLTTINGEYAMSNAFYECTLLSTINFNSLTTINGNYAMQNVFYRCMSLGNITFPSLTTIKGTEVFRQGFYNCSSITSISFPALTNNGLSGYSSQFYNMLMSCSGVTLHFPSNLQSTVASMTGYPNFGGSNNTILFDLPSTGD